MAKVLCRLPNASTKINGINFVTHGSGGMISEEIPEAVAKQFASINGYEIWDPGQTDAAAAAILEASRRQQQPPPSAETPNVASPPKNPAPSAPQAPAPQASPAPPPAATTTTPAPQGEGTKPATTTPEPQF